LAEGEVRDQLSAISFQIIVPERTEWAKAGGIERIDFWSFHRRR
jgi:hypothetical protein